MTRLYVYVHCEECGEAAGIEGEDAAGVDRRAEGADRESDVTGGWNQW